jgi:hypothetical protein
MMKSMARMSSRFLRRGFAWRSHGRRFRLFAGPGVDASANPADPGFICIVVDQQERRLHIDGGFTTFAEAWRRALAIVEAIQAKEQPT